jgi:hypothetical protein
LGSTQYLYYEHKKEEKVIAFFNFLSLKVCFPLTDTMKMMEGPQRKELSLYIELFINKLVCFLSNEFVCLSDIPHKARNTNLNFFFSIIVERK